MKLDFIKKDKKSFLELVVLMILAFIWNQIAYYGARLIAGGWYHHNMTLPIDEWIPLVPWTVVIYFGSYVFWGIGYCVCGLREKEERNRFFCADMISKIVCLIFFLALPATNVRPEITDGGVWGFFMRLLYTIDSPDNLFPSIHCLASWLCWVGVRGRKDIPWGFRLFSLLSAVAVCIVTLTTKQHVIVDTFAGILLAEIAYLVSGLSPVRKVYDRFLSFFFRLFRIEKKES